MKDTVSMFVLFARFFAIVSRRLEERLGEEGLRIMGEAVREWGFERGKNIAERAQADGGENNLMNYLENYDMEREEDFGYENKYTENEIFQEFTGCVFAETWMAEGHERYGRIYCENIDPAIARGYNKNLACRHEKIMYDDHKCTFCFYMEQENQAKNP